MTKPAWAGVYPAVTTQFRSDYSLDLDATARHVEVSIASGVHGLIFLGSVGENTALEYHEKLTVLKEMKPSTASGGRLVDVGTGTGVLAITFALERPGLEVAGLDISGDALELARENACRLNARVSFWRSDLLEAAAGTFDWVVANLPYIATGDLADLPREVKFDPLILTVPARGCCP